MNAFKLAIAAAALALGATGASADAKSNRLQPVSIERSSVYQSAAGRPVETRARDRVARSGESRPTIFGHDASDSPPLFGHYASSYGN